MSCLVRDEIMLRQLRLEYLPRFPRLSVYQRGSWYDYYNSNDAYLVKLLSVLKLWRTWAYEKEISEAVEAEEMVMRVEEQCSQARRLPVKMTWLSFMPFRARPRLRRQMQWSHVLFLSVTRWLLFVWIWVPLVHMCQFSLPWDLMRFVMYLIPPSMFLPQLESLS